MRNNTQLIYQNGIDAPISIVQNENFYIEWQKSEVGKYFGIFDYEILDKSKISILGFNSCLGGSVFTQGTDEIKITLDVSDEVNGIVLITEKNGLREDNLLSAFYYGSAISITDWNDYNDYTPFELSKLAHAQSILFGSDSEKLIALASSIGAPRPRP